MLEAQVREKLERIDTDLISHPDRYGFCTFEEFRKNKDKWRVNPEQTLASMADAGSMFKSRIRKIKYEMEGYACETIEDVQALSRQMGYRDQDLVAYPVPYDHLAGKFNILVRFFHKGTVKNREAW